MISDRDRQRQASHFVARGYDFIRSRWHQLSLTNYLMSLANEICY